MYVSSNAEKQFKPWTFYLVATGVVIGGLALVSAFFSKQPLQRPVSFLIYQIVAIVIPGSVYAKILKQNEGRGGIGCFFIAYALGYCSNIVWYYLLVLLGGLQSATIAYVVIFAVQGIGSIWYLTKKGVSYKEKSSNWIIVIIAIIVLFIVELFAYGGYNMLPPNANGRHIWHDVLYWIGNTVSLKLGYPPFNFRTLSENYTYHFFSSIQLAVESMTTGIPVAELSIYFSYIQAIVLIVGGLFCLFDKFVQNKKGLVLLFFLALFTSGYEEITRVSYVTHLYLSQFGFDYGLGLMLFLLLAVVEFYEEEYSWQNYIFMCVIFAALMGTKSPFACIGIVGIGCLSLYFLVKRNWKKAFVQGLSILFLFVFLYFFVCNISGYSGGNTSNVMSFSTHHWEVCDNLKNLRNAVFGVNWIPDFLLEIFFWILFVALCNPCLYIMFFLSFIVKIFNREKLDYLDITCYIMIIVGNSIALYIHMTGKSNTYFAMSVYPVVWLLLARYLPTFLKKYKAIWFIVMPVLVLYGGNLFLFHNSYNDALDYWKVGRLIYFSKDEVSLSPEFGISLSEYEALKYARDFINGKEGIIKVCDKADPDNLSGILSEHKMLNVDLDDLMSGQMDIMAELKEMNAGYLIAPAGISVPDESFEIIYKNEGWIIYKYNA